MTTKRPQGEGDAMKKFASALVGLLALLGLASDAPQAAGTLPFALQQQFSFTNCTAFTNSCGTPLIGGQLFFFQAGTNNVVQNSFQDTGLTVPNQWPLILDSNGRVPAFYLADGSVHVRLTDAAGVVQFDIPSMLVIGPSGGGGGGGGVDPTTIASTGDFKPRMTSEFLAGWVKANAQTIGGSGSGASQRAAADTQSLFVYLWSNCTDAHCPVLGGRGASGLADFNANKQITLPDLRGRMCSLVGLDDMGNTAAGRLLPGNVTSGGADTVTTPGASGGEANHLLTLAQAPTGQFTLNFNDPTHTHVVSSIRAGGDVGGNSYSGGSVSEQSISPTTTASSTGITASITDHAGGQPHNVMNPFMLGTCYMKL
jgi:hypothetical protein